MTARGPFFTGSETETQGCELKPHKPAIKQGHDPDKLSAHSSSLKSHLSLHTAFASQFLLQPQNQSENSCTLLRAVES